MEQRVDETPRERAERVLREHSHHCEPTPCEVILLARDVIALSDRLKYEPDWERAAHDYRAKAEKAEAALAEAQAKLKMFQDAARPTIAEVLAPERLAEAENQRLRETVEKYAMEWRTLREQGNPGYNSAAYALRELGLWKEPGE